MEQEARTFGYNHPLPAIPDWHQHAACNGYDNNIFFPDDRNGYAAAKAICAQCPVIKECREWAVETNPYAGVWGGLSQPQLKRLRSQRKTLR